MFLILAEALPQPVSEPVRYAPMDYVLAIGAFAIVTFIFFAALSLADKRMAKPHVIIITLLLAMFCSPVAVIFLMITFKNLKENPQK